MFYIHNQPICLHAFFSKQASEKYGILVFLNEAGEEVKATATYETQELGLENYVWTDSKYVGIVVEFKGMYWPNRMSLFRDDTKKRRRSRPKILK